MEKTLIIIKPDAVMRWLTGAITQRFEQKWLKMVASQMRQLDEDILKVHYAHIADKPFFPGIVEFMTSSPVILQIWEGYEVVSVVRDMIGVTNARKAAPWTIRWDYAMSIGRNTIHASENTEEAAQEIERFFDAADIYTYAMWCENIMYEGDEK